MRVWLADPRYLSTPHLLGAHNELHSLIRVAAGQSTGWRNHPEALRFTEVDGGLQWLLLMHEMTREAMNVRWPGKHENADGGHATPVAHHKHPVEFAVYEEMCANGVYGCPPLSPKRKTRPRGFRDWMLASGFPPTRLEHDTPWERDAVPFKWYREHERDWSHALVEEYHGGPPSEGYRYHGSRVKQEKRARAQKLVPELGVVNF